jgi:hypothetical protein
MVLVAAPLSAKTEEMDSSMIKDCVRLAELLNNSDKVNINTNEVTPLYTWRASCAERPPTGEGNVMALCEGTSVRSDGKGELLFFWSKTKRGKVNTGFFICDR